MMNDGTSDELWEKDDKKCIVEPSSGRLSIPIDINQISYLLKGKNDIANGSAMFGISELLENLALYDQTISPAYLK